jgi:hypothetical protein
MSGRGSRWVVVPVACPHVADVLLFCWNISAELLGHDVVSARTRARGETEAGTCNLNSGSKWQCDATGAQ